MFKAFVLSVVFLKSHITVTVYPLYCALCVLAQEPLTSADLARHTESLGDLAGLGWLFLLVGASARAWRFFRLHLLARVV